MIFNIKRQKFNVKGKLSWEYNALHNMERIVDGETVLEDFNTDKLTLDINHPVDIECQPSYDDSTNIIFNDNYNVPRIVNSAFSLTEDNSYERVSRNQVKKTNQYREVSVDEETRLQRTSNGFLTFDLKELGVGGELPGGNYVFLAQYSDDDDNKTQVLAESGIVSIWNGSYSIPSSYVGTFLHEKTDKQIKFELHNVDTTFSKLYLSFRRDFCDLKGNKQTEYKTIAKPYEIKGDDLQIWITGLEQTVETTFEELTEQRFIINKVKTTTQNQNVLFFGNVEQSYDQTKLLQMLALYIQVQPVYGNHIGRLDQATYKGNYGTEYFNAHNIYDNLGYMPEEYYRIGVVFIYNDDSRSMVYNLRGYEFETMYQWSHADDAPVVDPSKLFDINELFLYENKADNTKGVFRMPYVDLYSSNNISPIVLNFKVPAYILTQLKQLNIKGYYFVRQPRLPVFLTQGYSIGVSDNAYCPMLGATSGSGDDKTITYRNDSPNQLNGSNIELKGYTTQCSSDNIHTRGLLCPDVIFNKQLQSLFSGNSFKLKSVGDYNSSGLFDTIEGTKKVDIISRDRQVNLLRYAETPGKIINRELLFIPEHTPYTAYKKSSFSTKSGSSADVKSLRSISDIEEFKLNEFCVRGNYVPFVGAVDVDSEINSSVLALNKIYNIYTQEYGNDIESTRSAILKRAYNYSAYTSICDPISISNDEGVLILREVQCSRGDCFTCTSQHKVVYNFLDANTPLNEMIVKGEIVPPTGASFDKTVSEFDPKLWNEINVSDFNAVDIGYYVTLKYLSNFNHNIRNINSQNYDEISLYGSPRQFLPLTVGSGVTFKIPESTLVNEGLSTTTTVLPHFEAIQVPYTKNHFDTRVAFSNVSSTSSFANGYRVFSALSYQDIERTYGSIVKLLPFGSDLFCVFEHGCGILPVNEKALLTTTTGQSIRMQGSGVLQEQVTVISQDYGSTWEDSIVVTPNGIYGVDTWAKKLWRFRRGEFELISDQLVQRFLNDNITMTENDWTPTVALKNVKTHYNAYKGDVMFTFYKENVCWNLCYNERIGKFTTKYSWLPLLSENIQNSYVSVDKCAVEPFALIAETQTKKQGLTLASSDNSDYLFKYNREWTEVFSCPKDDSVNNDVRDFDLDIDLDTLAETENNEDFLETKEETYSIQENTCIFFRSLGLKGYELCDDMIGHIKTVSYSTWDDVNKKEVIYTYTNDSEHGIWIKEHEVTKTIDTSTDSEEESQTTDIIKRDLVSVATTSKYRVSGIGWDKKSNAMKDAELRSEDISKYSEEIDGLKIKLNDDSYYEDENQYVDTFCDLDDEDEVLYNNWRNKHRNYVVCTSGRNLEIEVKLNQYVNWIKITLAITPRITSLLDKVGENYDFNVLNTQSHSLTPFEQTICFVADYDHLRETSENAYKNSNIDLGKEFENYYKQYDNTTRVGLYTHGRAGIYDEINYTDLDPDNQIKPTFWYNKQEPFEFEFVVNSPTGMQKVFNNLALISNNAEPESLEVSIVGDAYDFNKSGIFRGVNTSIPHDPETGILNTAELIQAKQDAEYKDTDKSQNFNIVFNEGSNKEIRFNTTVSRDNTLNQYYLTVHDDCRDVKTWGKRLGNIEYREDKWLVTLSPIMFKNTFATKNGNSVSGIKESTLNSARLRDKWCKIRIKYRGDKLVVISAIQSFTTLSYS